MAVKSRSVGKKWNGTQKTFADSLKKEISRLARKELKGDLDQLRKLVNSHRSEIAALKRVVKNLQAESKALSKTVRSGGGSNADAKSEVIRSARRGRQPVFSAEGLKATRQRLGLTQAQLAALLEVSSLSVYKWESGQSVPRATQQERIFSLRKVGKRAVAKVLAERAEVQA